MRIFSFFFVMMALFTSCEPCAECGTPLLFDPTVKVKFINRDSLISLNDSISITEDSISNSNTFKDSLSTQVREWNTLMNMLRDSIDDGKDQYIADTLKIDDSLTIAQAQIQLIDTAIVKTEEVKVGLSSILSTVLSGKVLVDQVKILENEAVATYSDSSELYSLPLLMQNFNLTSFAIDIGDKSDTISFSYTTDLFVDTERRVEMRAFDIDTVSYTYDSLLFECNTSECLSNEVLVTVYF
ncbi:MAG: hypothetical protein JXR03_05165 [Cyclobacteriaceae bacterium]